MYHIIFLYVFLAEETAYEYDLYKCLIGRGIWVIKISLQRIDLIGLHRLDMRVQVDHFSLSSVKLDIMPRGTTFLFSDVIEQIYLFD